MKLTSEKEKLEEQERRKVEKQARADEEARLTRELIGIIVL